MSRSIITPHTKPSVRVTPRAVVVREGTHIHSDEHKRAQEKNRGMHHRR